MIDILRRRIPIRLRLTLWYVLLMGVTFTAFSIYLIFRFEHSLRDSIDSSLKITVTKTIAELDQEDHAELGRFIFDHKGAAESPPNDFAMRILSPQGEVWDVYSASDRVQDWGKVEMEYSTRAGWRIYNEPILNSDGVTIAWIQAAHSLQSMEETMSDLREQLLFGVPIVLLLAGLGGYFLADRALHPIEQITHTAQEITAQDLSRRLAYTGSLDEIGELAKTFDQMLERLESSFERERRFIGDAAHELRTPLTVLKGQIEVTLQKRRSPAEYEGKLQELLVQVDRLIHLSNALLFLSRSDQNQLSFHPYTVNWKEMLDVLVEQFQPLAVEKNLKITANVADGLHAQGDKDQLIRLFMNLLENGMKYTPAGGEITVTASQADQAVHVTIHNTGLTIPPEHLPHLFERFYRVDADRSSQTGGSGLGLAIAHEIVRMHAGEISVASEPGKGVKFTVSLPGSVD